MRFVPFTNLETPRLILRDIRTEDVYEYYERLYGDGDVCRYMLFDPHQDIGESLESIQRVLERYAEGKCYRWGVQLKEEEGLIGIIELLRFDEEKSSCSFAYMFGCKFWNQGYATETLKEVIRFAFEEMQIRTIRVDHMSGNGASGTVMRKAGMQHVATEKGKYTKHGTCRDAEVYEIANRNRPEMTVGEYQRLAMTTLNPKLDKKDVLINGVMGLCGESGEAIDIVKKWLAQGHELDREKLAKELGDIAWYLAETATALGMDLEGIFRANIEKLKKRYPEGFSAERSIHREKEE